MSITLANVGAAVEDLQSFIGRAVARQGGSTVARKPGHRIKFVWPPHSISHEFHVLNSDWTGSAHFEAYTERFDVKVARTPYGVFGRCESLWLEARGTDEAEMLGEMRTLAEPLFQRQLLIHKTLERPGRYGGSIRELSSFDLLKLLYCEDRDVANEAKTEIEKRASEQRFLEPLLVVLEDRAHANRRSAQWCVLDLFEDLPSFTPTLDEAKLAVAAIRRLIIEAEDDCARAIFKAGVVLGGHLPSTLGGEALLTCLKSAQRIGRRSAIHGLFHVVEWAPEQCDSVVAALHEQALVDPEPLLRDYAAHMARDLANGDLEHALEPFFEGEDLGKQPPPFEVSLAWTD
ncbi:MAG: hypothetical protein ACOYON_07775 [Fimbriimonas sp.]